MFENASFATRCKQCDFVLIYCKRVRRSLIQHRRNIIRTIQKTYILEIASRQKKASHTIFIESNLNGSIFMSIVRAQVPLATAATTIRGLGENNTICRSRFETET